MQLREFKIRASLVSRIMGRVGLTDLQQKELDGLLTRHIDSSMGRAKPLTEKMLADMEALQEKKRNAKLPETCITYLHEWVKEQIYNTRKVIKSKYLTKGTDVEYDAIQYYVDERNLGFVLPNTDHFSDEFMQGTPDVLLSDSVLEFKSSWDCFTFPLFDTEPDKSYEMQVQVYMHLTGRKKGKLIYTLQNTPDELVWDETVDYSDISSKYRIKEFDIDYDPDFIQAVQERVLLCREWIKLLPI